jgi:hypothetical protein
MEKFIEVFADVIKPPWSYLVGIVAVILAIGPQLMEFRRGWLELRLGRDKLEREKLRLEVLKLRIDLRQLAQQQQLPEIARELETVTVSPPSVVVPSPPREHRGFLWGLFAGHPQLGRIVLLIAQIVLGYFGIAFAIGAVVMPFVGWTDPEEVGLGPSILAAIFYAALAWLSYKGLRVAGSIRKELGAR